MAAAIRPFLGATVYRRFVRELGVLVVKQVVGYDWERSALERMMGNLVTPRFAAVDGAT